MPSALIHWHGLPRKLNSAAGLPERNTRDVCLKWYNCSNRDMIDVTRVRDINIEIHPQIVFLTAVKDGAASIKGLLLLPRSSSGQTCPVWDNKFENYRRIAPLIKLKLRKMCANIFQTSGYQHLMILCYVKHSNSDLMYRSCWEMSSRICNDWRVPVLLVVILLGARQWPATYIISLSGLSATKDIVG